MSLQKSPWRYATCYKSNYNSDFFIGYYISGINPGAKLLLGWDVIALINGRGGDERHLMLQEQQSESKLSVKKKNFNALESNQNQWY